ncbi:hypothetical protein MNV49_000116 [Pseudohyphozyma bogoriensis]|nr:hypothetical protein MNV49_000116 [Pseudohyphozyma bogoriensis]
MNGHPSHPDYSSQLSDAHYRPGTNAAMLVSNPPAPLYQQQQYPSSALPSPYYAQPQQQPVYPAYPTQGPPPAGLAQFSIDRTSDPERLAARLAPGSDDPRYAYSRRTGDASHPYAREPSTNTPPPYYAYRSLSSGASYPGAHLSSPYYSHTPPPPGQAPLDAGATPTNAALRPIPHLLASDAPLAGPSRTIPSYRRVSDGSGSSSPYSAPPSLANSRSNSVQDFARASPVAHEYPTFDAPVLLDPSPPFRPLSVRNDSITTKTRERPYQCETCGTSFQRSHDLKRHQRIHLEVKPFPCPGCEKRFSRRDALRRHLLVKQHPGITSDMMCEAEIPTPPKKESITPPAGSTPTPPANSDEWTTPKVEPEDDGLAPRARRPSLQKAWASEANAPLASSRAQEDVYDSGRSNSWFGASSTASSVASTYYLKEQH